MKYALLAALLFAAPAAFADGFVDRGSYDTGNVKSIEITLSATTGTVTSLTLPDISKGVRLYPRTTAVRWAVDDNLVWVTTSAATTVPAAQMATGGIAKSGTWETRLLHGGRNRILKLISDTANAVVDVEAF